MFVMLPYNSINLNVSVFLTNLYGIVHPTSAYTILAVVKSHHLFYYEGRRKFSSILMKAESRVCTMNTMNSTPGQVVASVQVKA